MLGWHPFVCSKFSLSADHLFAITQEKAFEELNLHSNESWINTTSNSLIQLLAMFNHFKSVFNTNVLNTLDAMAWKCEDQFYKTVSGNCLMKNISPINLN